GTDIGVFYRDNTLADWIPFSNGLPSVEVTDLELNLADNLLRAGTYGRGMWETSLYSNCVANLTLSTANQSIPASYYHQVSNNISSTAITLGTGAEVFYKSGVEVELKDGFIASALDTTSTFRAFIGPCGGGVPISRSTIFPPEVKTGRLVGRLKE
ncbi:MAG: 3-coathanger stack domain-containing protein, partial [Chitinophagaceae bacterium]